RLVELEVETTRQEVLELSAVEPRGAAGYGEARRVERALVGLPRLQQRPPRDGRRVVLDAGGSQLRRDQLRRREHAEIARNQRVVVDLAAEEQGGRRHVSRAA